MKMTILKIDNHLEIVRWFRINYDIHITYDPFIVEGGLQIRYRAQIVHQPMKTIMSVQGKEQPGLWHFLDTGESINNGWLWKRYDYETPEDALEAGILEAYKIINKNDSRTETESI